MKALYWMGSGKVEIQRPPVVPGAVQLFSSPCPPRARRTQPPQML
jgi:hypothetical protein